MQHLPAWARSRTRQLAALLFIIGVIVIGSLWIGHLSTAPVVEQAVAQDLAEAPPVSAEPDQASPTDAPPPSTKIIVYISGAVRAPDVYQLPSDARVKDLVLAAGGLNQDADPRQINLAERLKDEQHIHVPRQGEAAPSRGGAEDAAGLAPKQAELIDINTASAAELDSLPGIGISLANRIIDYRTANGPFKSVDDLRNVKGIGPALFTNIAPLITVGP